jgi:glycyl-tRNA synthetase (class II)
VLPDGGKTLTSGDSDCMTYSQTRTATYTDACLNAAVQYDTYTWKEDLVVTGIDYRCWYDLGCNQVNTNTNLYRKTIVTVFTQVYQIAVKR